MMRKVVYVLACQIVLSLVVGGCSSAESTRDGEPTVAAIGATRVVDAPDPTEEAGPPSDAVSQLIQQALRSDGSVSYNSLVRRLGQPNWVETQPVPNQYIEGQIDTLRTLVYTGIQALVYDVTNESKTLLVRLSLTSTQYSTPEGVRVGLDERRVIEQLGPPTRRNASRGELIYQESEPTPTSMVVHVRDGRVVQIGWEFYFT